jgi:hypothetical protein
MPYDRLFWTTEEPLVDWFRKNYRRLGFQTSIHEDDPSYDMPKTWRPDFLCWRAGEKLKVEIEKTATNYSSHRRGYADVVVCYVNDSGGPAYRSAEIIDLESRGFLGEITVFDELQELDRLNTKERIKSMGQSDA